MQLLDAILRDDELNMLAHHRNKSTRHPEEGHSQGWGVLVVSMPRRGGLPLFCFVAKRLYSVAKRLYSVARRDVECVSISKAALTKVDRHRIA